MNLFRKVLVANRGAVAARVIRSLRSLGIASVAVYSEVDKELPYLADADEAFPIGPGSPRESYLNIEAIINVLRKSGADGVHPGYGFLAEHHEFALAVADAGATFIGPSARFIADLGHKTRAREALARFGMPMSPSSGLLPASISTAMEAAESIGYPVIVKPANGGGGIGMAVADGPAALKVAIDRAQSVSLRSFGSAQIYLERYIAKPRHIEFQLLADRKGNVRHLFERDCSVQRRYQKVIEEAPAPGIDFEILRNAAHRVAASMQQLGYDGIGTVETLYESDTGFGFLEVNTRLQVEHAVTEEITGVDLVRSQIQLAAGMDLADVLPGNLPRRGVAIQARIYAEDSLRFLPSPGVLAVFRLPTGEGIRVETGYAEGNTVTPFYDPLIAKIIAWGASRDKAIERLDAALASTDIQGVKTNVQFVRAMLNFPAYVAGYLHTGIASELISTSQYKASVK